MKKIGITFILFLVIIAGALFWLRDNLDGLVRNAMTEYGSEMTQAKVSVGSVKIDAMNGEGVISDLVIGNPKGFKTLYAFKVKEVTIAIDPASISGDVVTVKKITIIAPDVIYEKGVRMTNYDAIQKNISDFVGAPASEPVPGEASQETKLIVEEFKIRNSTAQASAAFLDGEMVTVNLPNLTMRNIGKAEGGITPGALGQRIADAMEKQLLKAISFDKLAKTAQQAQKTIDDAASGVSDQIKRLF